jgi:histidinol-phosphate/aromatic aminotransferase/cobyric acid decarboxylase-like protein
MIGSIRRPPLSPRERRSTDPGELRSVIADSLGVPDRRLFLTHGATEGNAWVSLYVRRNVRLRAARCRVRYPEYPPLFDGPRALGFRVVTDERPADLAVVSEPRNPEGDDWPRSRLLEWAAAARHLLIDETFREFGGRRSWATLDREGTWTTGTFTKFYAGDDLRVGFVVAPGSEAERFGRFVGLLSDSLAAESVAGALAALRNRERIRRSVDRIVEANRRVLRRAFPQGTVPVAPVWFDRVPGVDPTEFARELLKASVLVCPGSFFGDPRGIRLCLTRRSFEADLGAYLAVRRRWDPVPAAIEKRSGDLARRRPGDFDRATASRA